RTPVDPGEPIVAPAPPHLVVVRAGDNLWVIAQRELRRGAPPAEIVPYWKRVIAANAATLRSHDPNLIFPGERIVLPAEQASVQPTTPANHSAVTSEQATMQPPPG